MTVLQENALLGPYRIAGLIGEGGMGAVYRAEDTRLGRAVAVKVLTNVTTSDRERLARFEQEARATGMLNHPNLLTIFDVGNADGAPFLVSELLEGETLRDRLDRGAVPPRKTVEVALQIASGLAAAHEKGVVHRDLKPENIFLTRQGRVKILDFGIAKLSPTSGRDGPTFQMAATEPGMVLGTVGYMSPEQVRGDVLDQRSDIFAFGTILYEMLSGTRALKRDTAIETLSAILKEEPPELSESNPNIPQALDRLVRRCLEKDREQRFQSARDLAFNLETLSNFSAPGTLSNTAMPHAQATAATASHTSATAVHTAHTAHTAAQQQPAVARPRTVARPAVRPRRVSPVLLTLFFIVAVGGAAFAGWYFATRRQQEAVVEPSFKRVTFRRGEVVSARFSPDGNTIVYSAAWDGRPSEIFTATRLSPEARPLGVADADVLAVSKTTELAVLLRRDRLTGLGTLARVPLAGGVPREVANNVLQADWSADGSQLAIIRLAENNQWRIEYPIGTVRYETPHFIRDIRVSPEGGRIAFIEPHGGAFDIAVIGSGRQPEAIARGWDHGANGLAWAPDGQSIWITGTSTSMPPSLYAVTLQGDSRLVSRVTGSMKLFDISAAGRVLLSNGTWRAAVLWQTPGETAERDVSWLDWSILADLSPDGHTMLFNETREGGGTSSAIYMRRSDAPTPVRIGDGYGDALSPDGKWVLCHNGAKLSLLPTGAGEQRELKIDGSFDVGADWLPDSRRVVIAGALPKHSYQLLLVDTLEETVKPLSPENIWSGPVRPFAVTPDGRAVAGMNAEETMVLYPLNGSLTAVPLPGVEKGEVPIEWSADGQSLFVYRPTALPAQVVKVTPLTGAREVWKQFAPVDPAGVYKISPLFMTPDAGAYAYNALRALSDLYVAEGLK